MSNSRGSDFDELSITNESAVEAKKECTTYRTVRDILSHEPPKEAQEYLENDANYIKAQSQNPKSLPKKKNLPFPSSISLTNNNLEDLLIKLAGKEYKYPSMYVKGCSDITKIDPLSTSMFFTSATDLSLEELQNPNEDTIKELIENADKTFYYSLIDAKEEINKITVIAYGCIFEAAIHRENFSEKLKNTLIDFKTLLKVEDVIRIHPDFNSYVGYEREIDNATGDLEKELSMRFDVGYDNPLYKSSSTPEQTLPLSRSPR